MHVDDCVICTTSDFSNFKIDGGFTVVCQNILSFDKNFDSLSIMLNELKGGADVLILTETWFSVDNIKEINGYTGYHSCRKDRRGGGCSIYIRDKYKSYLVGNFTVNNQVLESCCVMLKLDNIEVLISGIYRPPDFIYQREFVTFLESCFSSISPSKCVLVGGDLNVDMMNLDNTWIDMVDVLKSYNFLPYITRPTRVTENTATCIDHFWFNRYNVVKSGVLTGCDISDHFGIFIVLGINVKKEQIVKYFKDHSNDNLDRLFNEVQYFINDWPSVAHNDTDVNFNCNIFLDNFFKIYDKCCPIRKKVLSLKSLCNPWIDNELVSAIKHKFVLFRGYKSGVNTFDEYNHFKNKLLYDVRRAKKHYFHLKFSEASHDIRQTWRLINRHFLKQNSKSKIVLEDSDGVDIDSDAEISKMFSSYFSSIARDLNDGIPDQQGDPLHFMPETLINSFLHHLPHLLKLPDWSLV